MDSKRKEVRFKLRTDIYDELNEEAKSCDVPLASFIKAHIKQWRNNGRRRKKDI